MVAALCGCAAPPPVTAVPPAGVRPGQGRIWVYREYEPSESLAQPYVRLNGGIAGISEPGGSFYRDVAPGTYHVTADSFGADVNQFADVGVAAGQTVFVKIETARLWESDLNYGRDTFYTRVIPPDIAGADLRRSRRATFWHY